MKKFTYKFDGGVDDRALHLMDEEGYDVITVTRLDPGVEGHKLDDDQWQQVINMIVHAPEAANIIADTKEILRTHQAKSLPRVDKNKLDFRIKFWEDHMRVGEEDTPSPRHTAIINAAVSMLNEASTRAWECYEDAIKFMDGYMVPLTGKDGEYEYEEVLAAAYGLIEEGHPMLDTISVVEEAIKRMVAGHKPKKVGGKVLS